MRPLIPCLASKRRAARGLTMVEVLIVALIVSMLIGAIGLTVRQGSGAYMQGVSSAEVEGSTRRLVERVARELIDVDRSTLVLAAPGPAPTSVQYRRCEGFEDGELVLGPLRRLRLVMQPGEIDNGVDDNHNGLVDECRVELSPDVLGEPDQLVGWGGYVREYLEGEVRNNLDDNGNGLVDERGLCLTYDPLRALITVRATLERLDALGRPLTRTIETAVQVRND